LKQAADVVIVGAGVIGCSIAYALCKQGLETVILDDGEVGAQASQAASGMLAPLKPFAKADDPYTMLLLSSLSLFPDLIAELEEESDICIGYKCTGTLRAMRREHLPRLRTWVSQWQQAGYHVALLADDEIRLHEPGMASHVSLALYYPYDVQLNALELVHAYARAAEKRGAVFFTHEPVVALTYSHAHVTGVRTAQGKTIACKYVVLATGAWAAQSASWLNMTLPVYPLRGQSIALKQPASPVQHMLFGEGIYLAPKSDGTVISGVARDEVGFDVQTTPEGIAWLYERATKLVPALSACAIDRAWAGLLPRTPDARPILGFASPWENIILACGYNGYGLLLSAITGPIIAEQIRTGRVPESLRPFSSERFAHL